LFFEIRDKREMIKNAMQQALILK
ncbi:hypothetical protein OLS48_01005, partial [Campylobacter jejuni]|nr:hypothetical protein [Campylobacter jejuni]